jgi:P4 family phage/plasmid primase-like protien
MHHILQQILRERLLEKLPTISEFEDLPLTNTWDKVLDEGISKGKTNWQLFGSRKPGHQAYELTQHYIMEYDESEKDFVMYEKDINNFDYAKNLIDLSAQNPRNPRFMLKESVKQELQNRLKMVLKPISKIRVNRLSDGVMGVGGQIDEPSADDDRDLPLSEITNAVLLKRAVDRIMNGLSPNEYYIRETHEYTQILPAKYYEPGSHTLNRCVAFALKRTDERLFLSWVMLRSKASDFNYANIPQLFEDWKRYFNTGGSHEGITRKSIMYWAKKDNYGDFVKVKSSTIDSFVEQTFEVYTEVDCARVLYQMFKDKYVCTDINARTWYVFQNHRWVKDKGYTLRLAISNEMFNLYNKKIEEYSGELNALEHKDEHYEFLKNKITMATSVSIKFKKHNDKNNNMREAMEIFFDPDFVRNMDANKYLMCFSNGVIDFKEKIFREGYPQDCITRTTGIPYEPFVPSTNSEGLTTFMEQLFPIPDLCCYMWQHFASCLIGVNLNQTFNIYLGSGSNGKSLITSLMSHTLGEYKSTVPITLVTEKRGQIGGTSSEVIQLKGVRYAVMQEPSKYMKLNEGILKELTGGDPLQARALYSESEIFMPQFKLAVCTNTLFDIQSNDDGTWRRIRICNFPSKFVDEPEKVNHEEFIFIKDRELEEKIRSWAPTFASMLVKMAFETGGLVEDCEYVKMKSSQYRQDQDHIAAFVSEKVMKTNDKKDHIKKTELAEEFKIWYMNTQGTQKVPKGVELHDYMNKRFGHSTSHGWVGVKIIYNTEVPPSTEEEE